MPTTDTNGARAAILARLWGAADREPLPGIKTRHHDTHTLTITTTARHVLSGPRHATAPFADPHHLAITVDDTPITDPATIATLLAGDHPHTARLAREINDSVTGLAAARTAATPHPTPEHLWTTAGDHHPDPSVYFEQIVTDGHPLHPLCRARDGIDATRYAPEHHPRVELHLVPLDTFHRHGTWPWHDDHNRPLLPVHPLQAHRHPPGPATGTLNTTPLMSLRTLATQDHPHLHVKTALDIQLTSARRQVSPASIHNGPRLSRAIAGLGDIIVQRETGALAADTNGHPDRHLAAIVRQSPAAVLPPGHIAIPLAALAQPDPHTGHPLIDTVIATTGHDRHTWWHHCTDTLLPPLLRLAARGIGLEAHGQNTLLAVHDGHPTTAVYRDFGGVRVLSTTRARLGLQPLAGDLETTDPHTIHTKLIAAAYSVALAQLVHALAAHDDPAPWWNTVAHTTRRHTRDHPELRAALFADTWPIKATTAMRLSDDPTRDQWAHIPNPIASAA